VSLTGRAERLVRCACGHGGMLRGLLVVALARVQGGKGAAQSLVTNADFNNGRDFCCLPYG
jgi:hypothetical protein